MVCANSLQPNSAELSGTFYINSWELLLTGNSLSLLRTSSRCCMIHSCSEKGSKTMPKSNCEFISKATNLSRATDEGGVWFATAVYSNRLRPAMCNHFSACFVLFILQSKIFLRFTCALLGSNRSSRRVFGGAEAAWSLLRSYRHACKVMGWCKVSCHLTLSPQGWKWFWTPPDMKNNTQQQLFGKSPQMYPNGEHWEVLPWKGGSSSVYKGKPTVDSHLVSEAERPRTNPQWVCVSSWCPWQRVDCSWWSTPRLENNPQCFPKRLFSSTLVFTHKHWENMSTAAWDSRAGMGTCILFIYIPKLLTSL